MMKKSIALAVVLILCLSAVMCGCAPRYDTRPDKVEDARWITYDYSFCIDPTDDCKGYYKIGDKKYNIQAKFEDNWLTVTDTDTDKELFNADWMYEKNDNGNEELYIYNIKFNKDDYEELENHLAEYVNLKKEKI